MNEGAEFRTPQNNNLTSGPPSTLAHEDLQTILNSSKSQNMSGKVLLKDSYEMLKGLRTPHLLLTCRRDE